MDLGLTAKQVAEQLDVHHRSIINWEMGKVKPKGKRMEKVMGFLGK